MKKSIKKLPLSKLKTRLSLLKGQRGTWESHWQELTDHFLTNRNTLINKKTEGEKRTWQLLDNVGAHSLQLLAGAMQSLLTNPDLPWFELTTGNLEIDSNDNVRGWMQREARAMHNTLNNSNFQTEVHEMYLDVGGIGTAAMRVEEDEQAIVQFSTKFIAEYWISEGPDGYVNEIHYEWKPSPAALIEEFGKENLPEKVLKAFEKNPDEKFVCVHAIYPKYLVEPVGKDKMKFISQYYLPELDHVIEVGEYMDFPYLVPRWSKAAGETYGRCPAMTALPEMKVLNKMNETMLIGAQKQVDPPVQMEDDGVIGPLITKPGGINYRRPGSEPITPIFNDMRLDFGYQAMEDRRQRVRDSFYVDQLKLRQGGPMMTATEVLQRTEESMRLLGPLLGRMQSEFLRPLINRVFNIRWSRGLVEAPPPELQGRVIDVKYSSLIAKSQRLNEGQGIMRVLETIPLLAQINQNVVHNLNTDQIARILVGTYGAPQEMLFDLKQVQQQRQAMAEQAQAQAQQMQQQQELQNDETVARTMSTAQKAMG